MRQRDYSDLQELKEQAKDHLSFAAYQAYINGLEYHLEESRMLNTRLRDGMEAAMCAYDLANKEIEKTKSMKVVVDVSKDAFAARYVLGEGYPEKYYDAIGLRKSMGFMAPKEIVWPEELKSLSRPKYRLVLERVMDEDMTPVMKEDAEKITCDRCGKQVDNWDIVEIGSKEYCGVCEKLYDKDREAFEAPMMKDGEVDWDEVGKPDTVDREKTKKPEKKHMWVFQMCPNCGNKVEYWEDAAGDKLMCGLCSCKFLQDSRLIGEEETKEIDWERIKEACNPKLVTVGHIPVICEAILALKKRIEFEAGLIDAMRFGSDMK